MEEQAMKLAPERLEGRFLYMNYGSTGEYDRATDFIPDYHELLIRRFGGMLHSRIHVVNTGGHVPHGSIAAGLDYIYTEVNSD
jgi:hypothetical protein